ncbi:MAG: RNA methyltransferase [Myxococcaceae bacterium]|nr:RNA methyltransferase [Myxococcaceae bacterium]
MDERLFVGTTPGLESALEAELAALGFSPRRVPGGCELEAAPAGSLVRVNVQSRVASRVLWRLGEVTTPKELSRVPLRALVGDGRLSLELSEEKGERASVPAERWRAEALKLWGGGQGSDAVEVSVRLSRRGALVSVDTSGELLHVRGARQETGKAPLRETLASGLLRLAAWAPGESLWDVMCGSGTVLLEAAEQSLGLRPGRARGFAFERFPSIAPGALEEARRPAPATKTWLKGSDLNAGALGVARRNSRRAGVLEAVTLERLDATKLARPDASPGLAFANLPYGKRVGTRFELDGLYRALGASVRGALTGWRFAFLLQAGEEALGLPIDRTAEVRNGGLPCRLVTGRVV